MVVLVYVMSTRDYLLFFFFFFSSRRRHTRLQGDWSSECALPISRRIRSVAPATRASAVSGSRKLVVGGRGKSPVSLYGYFDVIRHGITTWSLAQSES